MPKIEFGTSSAMTAIPFEAPLVWHPAGLPSFHCRTAKNVTLATALVEPFTGKWNFVQSFLNKIGIETMACSRPRGFGPLFAAHSAVTCSRYVHAGGVASCRHRRPDR